MRRLLNGVVGASAIVLLSSLCACGHKATTPDATMAARLADRFSKICDGHLFLIEGDGILEFNGGFPLEEHDSPIVAATDADKLNDPGLLGSRTIVFTVNPKITASRLHSGFSESFQADSRQHVWSGAIGPPSEWAPISPQTNSVQSGATAQSYISLMFNIYADHAVLNVVNVNGNHSSFAKNYPPLHGYVFSMTNLRNLASADGANFVPINCVDLNNNDVASAKLYMKVNDHSALDKYFLNDDARRLAHPSELQEFKPFIYQQLGIAIPQPRVSAAQSSQPNHPEPEPN